MQDTCDTPLSVSPQGQTSPASTKRTRHLYDVGILLVNMLDSVVTAHTSATVTCCEDASAEQGAGLRVMQALWDKLLVTRLCMLQHVKFC
jgi:hypothetical protein